MPNIDDIDEMWAYIAADEESEGVAAWLSDTGWMPMVGADRARMESLRPMAQQLADASGKQIVLARFNRRINIETIEPAEGPLDPFVYTGTPDPKCSACHASAPKPCYNHREDSDG